MSDTSLSNDPFVKRTAFIAAVIALVLLLGGAAAYLLTRSSSDPDFTVAVGLVSPSDANRVAPGLVECPTTDRATSPLADTDFATSVEPAERSAFGGAQLVAYNLRITASAAAPDTARFVLRFSDAFQPGLRCAFVSVGDPDHAEAADQVHLIWSDASGTEPAGQIELSGLEGDDDVVAQLWVALLDDEQATRQMSLTVSPGTGTEADTVTRQDRASLGLPATAAGEPTVAIDDGAEPAVLGESMTTRYIVTNETTAVLNRVEITASIDEGATIVEARVDDTTGHPSSCLAEAGTMSCALGFLNPGESVPIDATVAVEATAVSFWGRARGPCQNDGQQDLCQRASLTWAGPFSPDSVSVSEVTNVDDTSVFSIEAVPTVDTGYALGSVAVNILVTTDLAQAEILEVSTTGCPVATYLGGDVEQGPVLAAPVFVTDGDSVLNAGELWVFSCAARQYVDGIIDVVVAGMADGLPGRAVTQIEIDVIDPALTMTRTEDGDVRWAVANTGDVFLESIAVSAGACEPTAIDRGDGDGVLDVDEVWTYTCPAGAGIGRAFAIDPLGATVSAADETATDAGDGS